MPLYAFRLFQAKQLPLKRGDTNKPDNVLHSISAFRLTETDKLTDNPPFISPPLRVAACGTSSPLAKRGGLKIALLRKEQIGTPLFQGSFV